MNSIIKLARLPAMSMVRRRALHQTIPRLAAGNSIKSLEDFDPENYNVPLRPVTLDDSMEPYGSWKIAYEAEKKRGNRKLLLGLVCFTATCTIFYQSGVIDCLFMPNLDNIMEDTEPFDYDKTDRVTV